MPSRDPRELFRLHDSLRSLRPRRRSRGRVIALWLFALGLTASLSFVLISGAAEKQLTITRANLAAAASPPLSFLDRTISALYRAVCPYFTDCQEPGVEFVRTDTLATPPAEPENKPEQSTYTSTTSVPPPPATEPIRHDPEPQQVVRQAVLNQPVIERIVERQRVVTEGGVTEMTLADRLNQMENKLRSLIFSQSSQQSAQTSAVYNEVALSQRIDNLSNTTIQNPTITGGSISGTSITGASVVGTITNAIQSALATIENLTSTELVAVNGTFTNATTTTLYAGSLGAGTASTTNATSTTLFSSVGRFLIGTINSLASTVANINAVSAVNYTATNATTTNATTTNLATANLRVSTLDCTGYANGGTLTTDANGNVVCAADDGGAGSSVGGGNTQVQFNDAGSFAGDTGFTYDKTADRVTVVNASTTNLTAAYASSTQGFFGLLSAGTLSLSSALSASFGGTGISNPGAAGVLVGAYGGGSWQQVATSSLGLVTTNVAEGSNLYFTNSRVASVIAGTTTDALSQGSTNRYYATNLFATDLAATTTDALREGGTNKYFTDARADARINATSSIGTLTSAPIARLRSPRPHWLYQSGRRRALDGGDQSRKRHNGHLAGRQRWHRMGQYRRERYPVRQRLRRTRDYDHGHGRVRPRVSQWRSRVDGHDHFQRAALIFRRRGLHSGGERLDKRLPFKRRLERLQYQVRHYFK